jgi:hypothetical protein
MIMFYCGYVCCSLSYICDNHPFCGTHLLTFLQHNRTSSKQLRDLFIFWQFLFFACLFVVKKVFSFVSNRCSDICSSSAIQRQLTQSKSH